MKKLILLAVMAVASMSVFAGVYSKGYVKNTNTDQIATNYFVFEETIPSGDVVFALHAEAINSASAIVQLRKANNYLLLEVLGDLDGNTAILNAGSEYAGEKMKIKMFLTPSVGEGYSYAEGQYAIYYY